MQPVRVEALQTSPIEIGLFDNAVSRETRFRAVDEPVICQCCQFDLC